MSEPKNNNTIIGPFFNREQSNVAISTLSVLRKIKTYKQPFFKLEKLDKKLLITNDPYEIRFQLANSDVLFDYPNLPLDFDHLLINYHPHFGLLDYAYDHFSSVLEGIEEQISRDTHDNTQYLRLNKAIDASDFEIDQLYASTLADLNSYFYYLQTRLNFPAYVAQVSKFERSPSAQLKESQAYLKAFFQPNAHFQFVEIELNFLECTEVTTESLEKLALSRQKLITYLKSLGLINSFTRYVWTVDINSIWEREHNDKKADCLSLKLLVVYRTWQEISEKSSWAFATMEKAVLDIIKKSPFFDDNTLCKFRSSHSYDTPKDKRERFNRLLEHFFDKPIWQGVYVIKNDDRKGLRVFGKGNDKE